MTTEETQALALIVLGPDWPHAGRGAATSKASDVVSDVLTRCKGSQRRNRNALLFVAADDAGLTNAREVIRKSLAWADIVTDERLTRTMTTEQVADAGRRSKSHRNAAQIAVRSAWSHVFYPEKSETPGRAFDVAHILISSRDRGAIPKTVYNKAVADGVVSERLGAERLWLELSNIWPDDRPHLALSELANWFVEYPYLPKLRDRSVLEEAVRDAVGKLDPHLGFADGVDEATGKYRNLIWGRSPPAILPHASLLVRKAEALAQLSAETPMPQPSSGPLLPGAAPTKVGPASPGPVAPEARRPRRFYGSVDIDIVRPVKAFEAIVSAVAMELQRTPGAKLKITLEIECEADGGFAEEEIGVVRDNARQLKFRADATGFNQ